MKFESPRDRELTDEAAVEKRTAASAAEPEKESLPRGTLLALVILVTSVLLISCASSTKRGDLSIDDLKSDEGYVVFRLLSTEMVFDSEAIWGRDIRMHYRPAGAGPIDAWSSTMRIRRRYVAIDAGSGPRLEILKLTGGRYVFYNVVTSRQEAPIQLEFEVAAGKVTYIGDVHLNVDTYLGVAGATQIGRAETRVAWAPDTVGAELADLFPEGVPPLRLRQAR